MSITVLPLRDCTRSPSLWILTNTVADRIVSSFRKFSGLYFVIVFVVAMKQLSSPKSKRKKKYIFIISVYRVGKRCSKYIFIGLKKRTCLGVIRYRGDTWTKTNETDFEGREKWIKNWKSTSAFPYTR